MGKPFFCPSVGRSPEMVCFFALQRCCYKFKVHKYNKNNIFHLTVFTT